MNTTSRTIAVANATETLAETAGKGIDAVREFGGFIARYTHGSLEQGMGIFEDKLKFYRWQNQARLMYRADEFMKQLRITNPRPIPLKFALPLLEKASLEDEGSLQDMWATLLANAANADNDMELKQVFINILERISPLEAQILTALYKDRYAEKSESMIDGNGMMFTTDKLPHLVEVKGSDYVRVDPSSEISLALANLDQLGCLTVVRTSLGQPCFHLVWRSLLGQEFVKACSLPLTPAV